MQDAVPRILSLDYSAVTGILVMEMCPMGGPPSPDRTCHLVKASPASGEDPLPVTTVAATPGFKYTSPVLTPDGRAVYAMRVESAVWYRDNFRAPFQVVRVDLTTGAEVVIARKDSGVISVFAVLSATPDREVLIMIDGTSMSSVGLPSGSLFLSIAVDPRTGRTLDKIEFQGLGSADFDFDMGPLGYIKKSNLKAPSGETTQGFALFRANAEGTASYVLFPTFQEAVREAAQCQGDACDLLARRAVAVAEAMERSPSYRNQGRLLPTIPKDVVARFEDRPEDFFPNPDDPTGAYHLAYDLRGGGIAIPLGPDFDFSRLPYVRMGGDSLVFQEVGSGVIDLNSYARSNF